jgi:hypothetical protein
MSTSVAIDVNLIAEADLTDGPSVAPDTASNRAAANSWPTFETQSGIYAAAARQAGRLNAATATEEELQALLSERQRLLDKQFDGTITRTERNRLTYVGWSLDRIEDARYGGALDILESAVGKYERFAEDLELLQTQISNSKPRPRRR